MTGIAKTIGRIIAVLVDAGIIERKQAVWILEPLKDTTVDADPVRHAKLLNAHPYGECSNCGYLIDIREEFNYCPNCGAYMKGTEDD